MSLNLNKVIQAGRLTRDPEMKVIPGGTAVTTFGVAVNETYKAKSGDKVERADFFEWSAFGGTAEHIAKHYTKGKAIYLEGRSRLDQWVDKTTGESRMKVGFIVDTVKFVPDGRAPASEPAAGTDLPPEGSPDWNHHRDQAAAPKA